LGQKSLTFCAQLLKLKGLKIKLLHRMAELFRGYALIKEIA